MIPQVKCCATCRKLQHETKYCHKKQHVRFNVLGDIKCEFWAWGWRTSRRDDDGPVIKKLEPVKVGFLDAVEGGLI